MSAQETLGAAALAAMQRAANEAGFSGEPVVRMMAHVAAGILTAIDTEIKAGTDEKDVIIGLPVAIAWSLVNAVPALFDGPDHDKLPGILIEELLAAVETFAAAARAGSSPPAH